MLSLKEQNERTALYVGEYVAELLENSTDERRAAEKHYIAREWNDEPYIRQDDHIRNDADKRKAAQIWTGYRVYQIHESKEKQLERLASKINGELRGKGIKEGTSSYDKAYDRLRSKYVAKIDKEFIAREKKITKNKRTKAAYGKHIKPNLNAAYNDFKQIVDSLENRMNFTSIMPDKYQSDEDHKEIIRNYLRSHKNIEITNKNNYLTTIRRENPTERSV